ncbi:MAG: desulfoferrodoxin [Candidatus Wallbacteria bacterium HGW-Wallbacteria-1]|jgi:superoxide reductase|uniref:Desulfoferrodoxin n=1 Tax=Candidatus Wallbacteria bacterium HGW-Wallbacteria-1 TaxID=2013854 RepID=A0A2N1PNP0_9BACT|nr:MAG: desulfoferrodoxin [Candidatus Wallbacteria bacterium HGW-Wallbacteria-1]
MAKVFEVYKCDKCGNVVEVTHGGPGALVCCGEEMKHLAANTVDAAKEKHVPVAHEGEGFITVKVGSVAHPMEEKHYIEFIEVITDKSVCRKYLKPGDAPEAEFRIQGDVVIRAYCNLHGLWKA